MSGVGAMAVQNALVQILLKNSPTTAVMTTNVTHLMLDLGELLAGGDAAKVAKARNRAIHTLPVIVGFTIGCGLGAACEAATGLGRWLCPRASLSSHLPWALPTSTGLNVRRSPIRPAKGLFRYWTL